MACDPVTEYLISESNRILPGEIYSRTVPRSVWMSPGFVERGEYPEQLGYDPLTVLTYERTLPTEANPLWTPMAIQSGMMDGREGGACLTPAHLIQFGLTKRTTQLTEYVVETPDFCAVNLRTAFQIQMQLQRIYDNMGLYTRTLWEIHNRHEYFFNCDYKVVVDGTSCPPLELTRGVTDFSSFTCTAQPLGLLTQQILDYYKLQLIRDGAAEGALGYADAEPQLTLVTDSETSDLIFRQNGDNRSDLRYGDPAKLLAPYGVGGPYRGFYHVIDPFPMRANCVNGVVTEVPPFYMYATSKGFACSPNPNWRTAQYTISMIHNRKVFQQLIPRPIVKPHPEWTFDPVNYTGIWEPKNIIDRKCNPDGTILYFRGHFSAASLPVHPEYGVAFLHKNCPVACANVASCPSS